MSHFELILFSSLVFAIHKGHLILYFIIFHRRYIYLVEWLLSTFIRYCICMLYLEVRFNTLKKLKFSIVSTILLQRWVSFTIESYFERLRCTKPDFSLSASILNCIRILTVSTLCCELINLLKYLLSQAIIKLVLSLILLAMLQRLASVIYHIL